MNPLPAPVVPGKSEAERFDNAVRQILSVPKEKAAPRPLATRKTSHKNTHPAK